MKSNSNFNITKVTVDPTSQELTSVYINGEEFSSGQPGPSEEYETWYVSSSFLGAGTTPLAINGNPYDANPDITHYVIPFNPNDEGDEMNWKKYEAYDAEVYDDTCGGKSVVFYLDIGKTESITIYTNEQVGKMAKIYIKSSDITDA